MTLLEATVLALQNKLLITEKFDKEEAEKFAKKYFKNFIGWYIYKTTSVR